MPKISPATTAAEIPRARRTQVGRPRAVTLDLDTLSGKCAQPAQDVGRASPSNLQTASPAPPLRAPEVRYTVTAPPAPGAPVPDQNAPAFTAPPPPSLASITPGGDVWWKRGASAPLPLEHIYLASQRLFTPPTGLTLPQPYSDILRSAAHVANVGGLHELLSSANAQLMRREVSLFGVAFARLPLPTIDQVDTMSNLYIARAQIRNHAAVHTLVGNGTLSQKIVTLNMLRGMGAKLADIRMLGLNLLHIACVAPMVPGDRPRLIQYLKEAGINPAGASDTGLTPLHCLAAQRDAVPDMEELVGWEDAFNVPINARSDAGETPLHIACATQADNTAVMSWLLRRGALLHERTNRGETLLHAVLRHGDHPQLVNGLLARGIPLFEQDQTGASAVTLCRDLRRAGTYGVMRRLARELGAARQVQRPYLGSTEATAAPPPGPMIPI